MLQTLNLEEGLPIFKVLSSPIRVRILSLIGQNQGIHITLLAKKMRMPVSTLAPHLHALADCRLIMIVETATPHGKQKSCFLSQDPDQLLIDFNLSDNSALSFSADIPVGHYSDFSVAPTCGLATESSFIGLLDDPRAFASPARYHAEIIWWNNGYLEYALPNPLPARSEIDELSLSFEISSEAPRSNCNWPSDISFALNGVTLGTWTSPGDFGDRRGKQNPDWWYPFLNQYGLLKKIVINHRGTFLDGTRLSGATLDTLGITSQSVLKFRFTAQEYPSHGGGCTLFGPCYGDYPQSIHQEIIYRKTPLF